MSFAAIFLFSGSSDHKSQRGYYLAFVVATLALSWLTTHVTFAYRYAHEYYTKDLKTDDSEGGLEFPGDNAPDYLDFIYFSFVLGMTFQVSDVNVTSKKTASAGDPARLDRLFIQYRRPGAVGEYRGFASIKGHW